MSTLRNTMCLLALGMALGAASLAHAQANPNRSPFVENPYPPGHSHTPFIDPDYFEPDFQLFAPAEVSEYGLGPQPNIGWYFTFDRVNWNVTRAEGAPQEYQGDATWGNRVDIGYMTEQDEGWLIEIMAVRGPNLRDDAGAPINVVKTSGIEISKVWRLEPLHHGMNIEPFLGVRFTQITDFTDPNDTIENNLLGLQIGYRASKQTGHWVLSNEFRFFAAQNWQLAASGDQADWVPAGDIRFEAAYMVSRDVAIRVGWELLYFGDGIARGNPQLGPISQDMLQTGVTFGFAVNR